MKKFTRDILIFVGLQLLLVLGLYIFSTPFRKLQYHAAINAKHERLAEAASPRLIFVGGSGLAFGLDSKRIEDAIEPYHVVNMGLHANLGLPYMMEETISKLKADDLVIVSPEYDHLWGHGASDIPFGIFLHRPSCVADLSTVKEWRVLFEDSHLMVQVLLKHSSRHLRNLSRIRRGKEPSYPGVYSSKSFNEYGDLTAHWNKEAKGPNKRKIFTTDLERLELSIKRMNRYHKICKEKGARVFFAFPQIPKSHLEGQTDTLKAYAKKLEEELNFPVINNPLHEEIPDELYYDSSYHLIGEGVQMRTARLIQAIKKELSKPVD